MEKKTCKPNANKGKTAEYIAAKKKKNVAGVKPQ